MKIDATVRLRSYGILSEVIERGIRNGYHRSFKYDDKPKIEYIVDTIHNEVMNEICEVIDFEHENQG